MKKEELKKQIEELKLQIKAIEEQEKEEAKVGEDNIAEGFKKALEEEKVHYVDFKNFDYEDKYENCVIKKTKDYFKFSLNYKDIVVKEFLVKFEYDGVKSIIGVFYKNTLIFGVLSTEEYWYKPTFITAEETMEIYKSSLWNI